MKLEQIKLQFELKWTRPTEFKWEKKCWMWIAANSRSCSGQRGGREEKTEAQHEKCGNWVYKKI